MPVQMKGASILHCRLLQSKRDMEGKRMIERDMEGDKDEGKRDREEENKGMHVSM